MIKEVCVENFTNVPEIIRHGADRIELCDNLSVGGTTVSEGVLKKTIEFCRWEDVSVMVIIRPRGGDYVYSDLEKDIMLADIEAAIKAGASGIVIGALTRENKLDKPFLTKVSSIIKTENMALTFHMAFDEIADEKQEAAIDWLAENHFDRILVHGGSLDKPIENNLKKLRKLVEYADDRIIILPGGGITLANRAKVVEELGVNEVHGTKVV